MRNNCVIASAIAPATLQLRVCKFLVFAPQELRSILHVNIAAVHVALAFMVLARDF